MDHDIISVVKSLGFIPHPDKPGHWVEPYYEITIRHRTLVRWAQESPDLRKRIIDEVGHKIGKKSWRLNPDPKLRELQQQAATGDVSSQAQYWSALLRIGAIPEEYIMGLARAGNIAAQNVIPNTPKNQSVKNYVSGLLIHEHMPVRDIYDFALNCLTFLGREWRAIPDAELPDQAEENHYRSYQAWHDGIRYLRRCGTQNPPNNAIPSLIGHINRMWQDMEQAANGLTSYLTCDSLVEFGAVIIALKLCLDLGEDPTLICANLVDDLNYSDIEFGWGDAAETIEEIRQRLEDNRIYFSAGGTSAERSDCIFEAKDLLKPWKKFLHENVILPIRYDEPLTHRWMITGRVNRANKNLRLTIRQQVDNRFKQMVQEFLLERITRATATLA